ncbi:MAG: hypothetical protein ACU83N_10015 [Gammaproteobacteria bacterium]
MIFGKRIPELSSELVPPFAYGDLIAGYDASSNGTKFIRLLSISGAARHVVDQSEADQGVTAAGTGQTVYDIMQSVGTSSYAVVKLVNDGNNVSLDTDIDCSTYPNLFFEIEPGAYFDQVTGDETITFYSTANIIASPAQKIFNGNCAAFLRHGIVHPEQWGAKGDNSTVNTNEINYAINTGMNVLFLGGIFLTAGGHRIATNGQDIAGSGRESTIIKKSSGTSYLLDTSHAVNFVQMHDISFDANSLGGSCIIWRAHYSNLYRIHLKNQGGTSYALWISGINLSKIDQISSGDGCYGFMLIDQSTDSYSPQPSYSALYSKFTNLSIAQTNGGAAINLTGNQPQILSFKNTYFEDTQAAVPSIWVHGSNAANIDFYDTYGESVLLYAPLISVTNSSQSGFNVRFSGGRISTNVAQTESIFNFDDIDGVTVEKMLFIDPYSSSGRKSIELTNCKNADVKSNKFSFANNFYCIYDNGGNSYVTEKGNTTRDYSGHTGKGSNSWNYTSSRIVIDKSEFSQTYIGQLDRVNIVNTDLTHSQTDGGGIAVGDDGYYDIFGDGGATTPNRNFAGMISIRGGAISATSNNNFALFYAESGIGSGEQKKTEISVGSNVEITVLADDTAAALSSTTDGKLGVQIGGGSAQRRFIRVYNRTGGSITLSASVVKYTE